MAVCRNVILVAALATAFALGYLLSTNSASSRWTQPAVISAPAHGALPTQAPDSDSDPPTPGEALPTTGPPSFAQELVATPAERAMQERLNAAFAISPREYLRVLVEENDTYIVPWRPGIATPIVCDGMEYYSGHFSIPAQNIIAEMPVKLQDWATVVPGRKETYVFKREVDYRNDLERSRLGITRRRYGFATNRNLEMHAAGAVPYFCGIDAVPRQGTLASLPKQFYAAITRFPGITVRCFPHKKTLGVVSRRSVPPSANQAGDEASQVASRVAGEYFDDTKFDVLSRKLLNYTKTSMTTVYMARYFLSATSLRQVPKHVLVLWASHYTIMLTGFINGLRQLGVTVEDVPRRPEIYEGPECAEAARKTYAKGWFFFCRTTESQNITRANIRERILAREFDLVVISITDTLTYHLKNVSTQVPYWKEITSTYPRDLILTLNDADLIKPMQADVAHKAMWNATKYFKRETHGCHENIW